MTRKSVSKALVASRSLLDGLAILLLWAVIAVAGCSSNKVREPRTVEEWMRQPRVGEDLEFR